MRAVLHSGGEEDQDMPGDNPPRAGQAVSGGHNDSVTTDSAATGGSLLWCAGARVGQLLASSA
ncbi:MAG: hypothetical protein E5W78_23050, partial [Mesorhizobium sp.]